MFRSDNVGLGIRDVTLKGANNPRSTGGGGRTLILNPNDEKGNEN